MRRLLLTLALALPLAMACAQPADPPTPKGNRGAKRNARPDQEERQFPPPYFAPEILEFREHLEKEDPEEFKRLEELKRTDRKAFREEMSMSPGSIATIWKSASLSSTGTAGNSPKKSKNPPPPRNGTPSWNS